MKILLVYVCDLGSVSSEQMKKIQNGVGILPSLGLMNLASWISAHTDWHTEILDCRLDGISSAQACRKIVEEGWDAVGISCLSHTWPEAWALASLLKEHEKAPAVIMGGPHAALYPLEILSHKCVDYVVSGEGEIPLAGLLERLKESLKAGKALPDTDGLDGVMRLGDGLKPPYVLKDLNILPVTDRSFSQWQRYFTVVSRRNWTTTITSGRGCPYSCRFCWTAGGKKVRKFSPEHVVKDIESAVELGIREFFFFDELFTSSRSWAETFCSLINKRGLDISWDVRSRVDTVDAELLKMMAGAGCSRVQYGAESGNDRVLKILGKGITSEQIKKAIKHTKEAGLASYADFMIGAPGETEEEIEQTINFAVDLKLDYAHFSVLMLYPYTKFYDQALKEGILKKDVWREYASAPKPDTKFVIPYWDKELSRERLDQLAASAYKRFCFRPEYIIRRLRGLSSMRELLMCAEAALGLL